MQFEILKEKSSIIKVIGVGGGGGNAVNHMYRQGITGVDFIVCNTDAQALEQSPIPNKIQLGASLTEGMGAGSVPEVGKNSAIENIEDIKQMLGDSTKMLFITAGMGGGTGTGASPIIARAAREMGILTVAIVTTPFVFEGKRRQQQAIEGLEELKQSVDSILIISNDRLRQAFVNLTLSAAFAQADNILTTAAKGIAEIITVPGYMNVDFKDVNTVMKDSGVAIMGSFTAAGQSRALHAVKGALESPLLKDNEIEGARYILLNISSGVGENEVTMEEVTIITDYIQEKAGLTADLIWGNCSDDSYGDQLAVTIIATAFQTSEQREQQRQTSPKRQSLSDELPIVKPLDIVEEKSANTLRTTTFKLEVEENSNADNYQIGLFSSAPVSEENAPSMEIETPNAQDDIFALNFQTEEFVIENNPFTTEFELKTIEEPISTPQPEAESKIQATVNQEEDEPMMVNTSANETLFPEEVNLPEIVTTNPVAEQQPVVASSQDMDEQLRKTRERILRLKDLSMKLNSARGLQELENEPAYKRKQMAIKEQPHSSESLVSRFTLSENPDGTTSLRENNSFLHDNVD